VAKQTLGYHAGFPVRVVWLTVGVALGAGLLLGGTGCPARDAEGQASVTAAAALAPDAPTDADVEADAPEFLTRDMWFGVYMRGGENEDLKIGYQYVSFFEDTVESANRVDPFLFADDAEETEEPPDDTAAEKVDRLIIPETYEGDKVQAVRITGRNRIQALGTTIETDLEMVEYLAPDGTVLAMVFSMASAGMPQRLFATFYEDSVEYVQVTPQGEREGSVPVPEGAKLMDVDWSLDAADLEEGQTLTFHTFIPIMLSIEEFNITVGPMEEISFGDETVEARRLETEGFISATTWLDDEGMMLVMDTPIANLRVIREPAEVAKTMEGPGGYVPPVDLLAELQITVDETIEDPRDVRRAKLRISEIGKESMILSDDRQTVTDITEEDDGTITAVYEMTTQAPPEEPAELPVDAEDLSEFLEATTYIQCDDERLIELAAEIVADETDSLKAAQAIARWVSLKMRSRWDIGLVRSALEVLESKEGVCRDYAVLFAGLARAAGIPTRYVGGIVYWKTGFLYHAWNEVYVGKWIAIDTTRSPGYPVDATHIKFAEGNVSSLLDMIPAFGVLEIEVQETAKAGE